MGVVTDSTHDHPGQLWLLRHGQTEWSQTGRHTGLTDIPLTEKGEEGAALWAPELGDRVFAAVCCSPRLRARRTAELAGLTVTETVDDLGEWDYGQAEGRTTAQMREEIPDWDVWKDGPPGGETLDQLGARVDRVLAHVAEPLTRGDVMLVAHGHVLRVLVARWISQPPVLGSRLGLKPAGIGILGHEHDRTIVVQLGLTPGSLQS